MSACSFTLLYVPPIVVPIPSLPIPKLIGFAVAMPDPSFPSLGFTVPPIVVPVPSLPIPLPISFSVPGVGDLPGLGFSVPPIVVPIPSLALPLPISLPIPACPLD